MLRLLRFRSPVVRPPIGGVMAKAEDSRILILASSALCINTRAPSQFHDRRSKPHQARRPVAHG